MHLPFNSQFSLTLDVKNKFQKAKMTKRKKNKTFEQNKRV